MALFFFHFLQGTERHTDEIGLEMPHAEAAYLEAVATAKGMGSELIAQGVNPADCSFEIADEHGATLFSIAFTELFAQRRAEPTAVGRTTQRLIAMIEDTHRRAMSAKADVQASLTQARSTLFQSHSLIAQLDGFKSNRP